jgi:hypothetical protein
MVFILVCVLSLTAIFTAVCASLYALASGRKAHMAAQQMQLRTEAYTKMVASWTLHAEECTALDMAVRQCEIRKGVRAKTGTRLGYAPRSN